MRVRALLLTALLILAIPVSAQTATAPSPTSNTLWAHPDPDLGGAHFMNTQQVVEFEEPPGNEDPMTGSSFTWTMTLDPGLVKPLYLEEGGRINITAHVGAGLGGGDGFVSTQILAGETVVADGAAQAHTWVGRNVASAAGESTEYEPVIWQLEANASIIPAGTPLVWTVTLEGTGVNAFLGVSDNRGRSHIVLPILPPPTTGPDPTAGAIPLDGDLANVTLVFFEAPTTQSFTFAWPGPAGNVTAATGLFAFEGEALVTVKAPNGTVVLTAFADADSMEAEAIENVTAEEGPWIIEVEVVEFIGAIVVIVAATDHPDWEWPEGDADGGDGPGSSPGKRAEQAYAEAPRETDTREGGQSQREGSPGVEVNDKKSPGLGVVFALALLAFLVRRRSG